MAIVTRFFDVSGAGSADGTSYANRAPLIVSGLFNNIIRSWPFNGSDALECALEPGIYTGLTTNMAFSVAAPTATKRLFFRTAGFTPPRWLSAQPIWSRANMARIQANIASLGIANTQWYGICFEASINSIMFANAVQHFDWCIGENAGSGAAVTTVGSALGSLYTNCAFRCTSTNYASVVNLANAAMLNCRLQGNPSATTSTRNGLASAASPGLLMGCTICDNPGNAIHLTAATGNLSVNAIQSTFANNGNGILVASSNTTAASRIDNSFLAGAGNGIDVRLASNSRYMGNRIRVGGTPIVNQIDWPSTYNDTASGSDADEFVDAANGDFRIKRSSIYWGKGIGAGDEPALRSYGFTY